MKVTHIVLLISCFSLFSCDKGPSFAELCVMHSEICHEFEQDSWCKRERIAVGFANLNHVKTPLDPQKFEQLIAYEGYAQCMAHASKIEHIKFKNKQVMRVNNLMKAREQIKVISQQTNRSLHPDLLYFHWSRYLNKKSLAKFLALENTLQLETPKLQLNLATYYVKRDKEKTLQLLYHSLELSNDETQIDTEVFKSISTLFAEKKDVKNAYIWSKILHDYDSDDKTVTDQSLENYLKAYNLNSDVLDQTAEDILDRINDGEFKEP
ncbi:MAG: DUF2989 domain-containing protein [Colwellia sp.]|nr:DUF2989 domain-containing protein [Colwellia sp.]